MSETADEPAGLCSYAVDEGNQQNLESTFSGLKILLWIK